MITAIVQFNLPASITPDQAQASFAYVAAMFRDIPGLIRKYFLLSEDGTTAGGVYLWNSREDAENFYTENFKLSIVEKFGSEPAITYFGSPVIVDNFIGEIIAA
jgi:hypothetical protein